MTFSGGILFLMRLVRALLGIAAITLAIPLLGAGTALWVAGQHRSPDGWFVARLDRIDTPGYAVVVPDVDALLRRHATLARDADTRLRITARTDGGPAFVGLAPRPALERYLSGVPYATLSGVRPALGQLPVTVAQVDGTARPDTQPAVQPFWVAASVRGAVDWSPGATRGQQLALVVMRPDGAPALHANIDAGLRPAWLGVATWGSAALGVVSFIAGLVLLLWPARQREVVFVVEPDQVDQVAARLRLRSPRLAVPASPAAPVPASSSPCAPVSFPPPPFPGSSSLPGSELVAVAAPAPGWMLGTAEIVDVSSLVSTVSAPITPDFVWPPVSPTQSRPEG